MQLAYKMSAIFVAFGFYLAFKGDDSMMRSIMLFDTCPGSFKMLGLKKDRHAACAYACVKLFGIGVGIIGLEAENGDVFFLGKAIAHLV